MSDHEAISPLMMKRLRSGSATVPEQKRAALELDALRKRLADWESLGLPFLELGYKACERGDNLEKAIGDVRKAMGRSPCGGSPA